jgi:hypothetical protein
METVCGHTSSFIAALTVSPVCVPLTKITVRGSSISFGSRASRARFDRAFLGFLREGLEIVGALR